MKKLYAFVVISLLYSFFAYPASIHAEHNKECVERGMSGYFEATGSCFLERDGTYIFN